MQKTDESSEGASASKINLYSYIRWSSQPQTWGDSERRQLQEHQDWAARRGLKLSERTFADRGVSAKAGKNLSEGALGELVKIAKPGDIILLEEHDRFSRQNPLDAMLNLREIVNRGVNLVFTKTNLEVTRANFNEMHVLFQNFFQSFAANAENQKKSFRVKESWQKRRTELRSGKATRQRLPCWLIREKTVDASGKVILGGIKVDEVKAATVREIFKLTLAGWGSRRIAQHFTQTGVPVIAQGARWNGRSMAATIITNPSVIGHYRVLENKKPTSEVIKNIYPAIIDERTFYACQKQVTTLRKLTTPNGAVSANIATGLCRCPSCGGNMSRNRHHSHGKVYSYLICGRTKAGSNRTDCSVRPSYDAFEASLLGLLSHSDTVQRALGQARAEPSKIAALSGKLAEADKQAEKILRLIEGDDAPAKSLVARLKAFETEAETLRLELQSEEAQAKATTSPQIVYETFKAELKAKSQTPAGREPLKAAIRDIVDQIQFMDKTTYMVEFKGGCKVCVCMPKSGFKWETMEQLGGPLSVP